MSPGSNSELAPDTVGVFGVPLVFCVMTSMTSHRLATSVTEKPIARQVRGIDQGRCIRNGDRH